jgi:hypothetical protein
MPSDTEARLRLEWDSMDAAPLPHADTIIEQAAPERASRRAVLVELEDVRLSLTDLRTHIEASGRDSILATSRWTIRELIAHLAAWAMRTRQELESLVGDKPPLETIHFEPDGGPRAWNQREVDARNGRSTRALFDELDTEIGQIADVVATAPQQFLAQVAKLPRTSGNPPAQWRMTVAAMIIGSCWHIRYHLARLERG